MSSKEIDKKTVEHIARLSKIKLSEAEKEDMMSYLNNILPLLGELQNVDTDGVEPLMSVLEVALPNNQQAILEMQPDKQTETDHSRALLKLSPSAKEMAEGGFFVVPKVVGHEG